MKRIKADVIETIFYEPVLKEAEVFSSRVINDLTEFKRQSDVLIAKRITSNLCDRVGKVYLRDIFGNDA